MIRGLLKHPLARDAGDIDALENADLRRRLVQAKPFLRRLYQEWYRSVARALPEGPGTVLEIGSGTGFLGEFVPHLITSDVQPIAGLTLVADARALPVEAGSLRGIVMINVLHQFNDPVRFFREASRALRPGGAIVLIEPWNTSWSRFVYQRLHHETFLPDAPNWENGPHGALPWILFARDRGRFETEFPALSIGAITVGMPLRYLLSGGLTLRGVIPGWSFPLWRGLESRAAPWMGRLGMFARIELRKVPV